MTRVGGPRATGAPDRLVPVGDAERRGSGKRTAADSAEREDGGVRAFGDEPGDASSDPAPASLDLSPDPAQTVWDVAVVGAGPAGASAARVAAEAGARVVLLEKASLPRYKTCGGGLIGLSTGALPEGFDLPVRQRIDAITFTQQGRRSRTKRDRSGRLLALVNRAEFDHALAKAAVEAGAVLREGAAVTGVEVSQGAEAPESTTAAGPDGGADHTASYSGPVVLTLSDGSRVTARAVIGADGSASRIARHVGVVCRQVDLGLEAEIPVPPAEAAKWSGRVLIDWGPLRGSYGWVFPKGEVLTVGVISARGDGEATRAYYRDFVTRLGLDRYPASTDSGHLTRCRTAESPLSRGRVLVAGDAAGLLEPWTREGISYALRSGRLAGEAAARLATTDRADAGAAAMREATADYRARVEKLLGVEMTAGERLLAAFEKHPGYFHAAVTTLPRAWRAFADVCRGHTTFGELLRSRAAQAALRAIS